MKIKSDYRIIPIVFMDEGFNSDNYYGNKKSYKYRLRKPNYREDLYAFANENGYLVSINHLKAIYDPNKDCQAKYNTIICFKNKINSKVKQISSSLFYNGSNNSFNSFIECDINKIFIRLFAEKVIVPNNEFGKLAGIKKVTFTTETSIEKSGNILTTSSIVISYIADIREDEILHLPLDDTEFISMINEVRGLLYLLNGNQNEIGTIIIISDIKNACEKLNEKYALMCEKYRGYLSENIEKTLTRNL